MASRFAANLSMLFTGVPLLARPATAADAGVHLVGLNFFAGDMPAGDRGKVYWRRCQEEASS